MEALLGLALVALIVMSTAWFQHTLERQVITRMETITGGRVEIGYFHFRPWLFQVTLQKLVIHGLEGAGEQPLMSIGAVDVGLSPEEFLRRRFRLRHLDMDELQIHLRVDAKGVMNLPGPREQLRNC